MKSRSKSIFEKSVSAILAAIELYNKPDFFYREESFSILAVNAWELLLKARILQLSSNSLSSITKYEQKKTKSGQLSKSKSKVKNRSGNVQTIGLFKAFDMLNTEYSDPVNNSVRTNLEALVEIRDNSVHLINKGIDLERKVLEVGTAAISNYLTLSRQWFGIDLSKYNIFLMPIAFIRDIPRAEGVLLNSEERRISSYLQSLSKAKNDSSDFSTTMGIEIKVKRAKDNAGLKFTISNDPDATPVRLEEEDLRDKFPWTYDMLISTLRKKFKFKRDANFHKFKKKLESDKKLCNVRLLDPGNPKSSKKTFYSPNIVKEFAKMYEEL